MRLCGTGATLLFWNSSSLVFYSFLSPQSNLGPQFPSGRGNARGHKDGRPGSHEDARPNLGGQMGTSRPIDECARRGRPGDSRKGAERFYHAKPRPHLARIFGQAREAPTKTPWLAAMTMPQKTQKTYMPARVVTPIQLKKPTPTKKVATE